MVFLVFFAFLPTLFVQTQNVLDMIEMKMTEEIAYAFFIGLLAVSAAIGVWLHNHEKKRNQQKS
ncbi:MAG: hypothetical protein OHK0045_14930 [Raineya sp.]